MPIQSWFDYDWIIVVVEEVLYIVFKSGKVVNRRLWLITSHDCPFGRFLSLLFANAWPSGSSVWMTTTRRALHSTDNMCTNTDVSTITLVCSNDCIFTDAATAHFVVEFSTLEPVYISKRNVVSERKTARTR